MEEKSELNDIILNKGGNNGSSKKVLLAIATLAIVLIIVVVIMNRISATPESLPQPVMPPKPTETAVIPGMAVEADSAAAIAEEDPLFVPVPIIEEQPIEDNNIDKIAKKLKEESQKEKDQDVEVIDEPTPQPVVAPKQVVKTPAPTPSAASGKYYVQVGSFSKYQPDKQFLDKITKNGYSYTFHKEKGINKVLIGPFSDEKSARKELINIRKTIKNDAFLKKV